MIRKKTYISPSLILLGEDDEELVLCYSSLDDIGDEGGFDDGDF